MKSEQTTDKGLACCFPYVTQNSSERQWSQTSTIIKVSHRHSWPQRAPAGGLLPPLRWRAWFLGCGWMDKSYQGPREPWEWFFQHQDVNEDAHQSVLLVWVMGITGWIWLFNESFIWGSLPSTSLSHLWHFYYMLLYFIAFSSDSLPVIIKHNIYYHYAANPMPSTWDECPHLIIMSTQWRGCLIISSFLKMVNLKFRVFGSLAPELGFKPLATWLLDVSSDAIPPR